jgi:hypothetical protein
MFHMRVNDDDRDSDSVRFLEWFNNPEIVKTIQSAVTGWTQRQPGELKLRFRALHLAYAFCAIVFLGIGLLAWFKVLSGEVTASLLGSLIGYWFGQRQAAK